MKQYLVTIKEIIDVINLAKDRDLIKKNIKFWLKSGQPVKVMAEGEIDNVKWESPYNKLVFYFKGLPKMIGIKIIKSRKIKIILKEQS